MASELTILSVNAQPRARFEPENILGVILLDSPLSSASVGYVEPGMAQARHFHLRPDRGEELIFVDQGHFRLVTSNGPHEFNVEENGPVFIRVPSGTEASIENVGANQVRFLSVFVPPFAPGEIQFLVAQ